MYKYYEKEENGVIYVSDSKEVASFLENEKKCYRVPFNWAWRENGAFFHLGASTPQEIYYNSETGSPRQKLVKAAAAVCHWDMAHNW